MKRVYYYLYEVYECKVNDIIVRLNLKQLSKWPRIERIFKIYHTSMHNLFKQTFKKKKMENYLLNNKNNKLKRKL